MLHFIFLFLKFLLNIRGKKWNLLLQDWIYLTFIAAAIFLSFWEISENDGLAAGSEAQQLSIRDFHSGSHHVGTCGRNVLFTIPPVNQEETHCNIMVEFCSIIRWPYLNSEYNIQLDPRNIATGYKIIQEDKLKPKNEFQ